MRVARRGSCEQMLASASLRDSGISRGRHLATCRIVIQSIFLRDTDHDDDDDDSTSTDTAVKKNTKRI